MENNLSPIISVQELIELKKTQHVILIDASAGLNSKQNYIQQHLAQALYVDLNTDLANIGNDAAIGGRHPLPELHDFAITLSHLGISVNSHVVVYDDKNASNAAARFWWMLKSIGHEKVQVLNGGYQAALKEGFEISSGEEIHPESLVYPISGWKCPTVNIQQVDALRLNKDYVIIDVRDKERFDGYKEPIDLIAGHIPGAVNMPFISNLDENGLFLKPEVLREKYLKVLDTRDEDHTIIHCGSGVTACHTILAMAYAGFKIPSLYVGSWSEWSRNNKPIGKN